jgi:uncharacterized LabA/DUF88 family protein
MVKVITYIDGYNLYHALMDQGWRRYLWLDLQKLSQGLLKFNQELVKTKYFTSRTTGSAAKRERQTKYIEALGTLSYVELYMGRFQDEPQKCPNCQFPYTIPKEKKTDVGIATEMVCDAFNDEYDTAILISADADLVPAIIAVKKYHPIKRVVIALPPNKTCAELISVAHSCFPIGRSLFAQSQLSPRVKRDDGFILERPVEWV